MTKQEFEDQLKVIFEKEELKPDTVLGEIDSLSRVEIIILVEEYLSKTLTDAQLKVINKYKDFEALLK
jgi:acyl carrier protein